MTRRIHDLSVGWTVWMPLAPVTLLLVLGIFYPEASGLLVYKEGPIEWATVVAALIGSGAGVVAFHRRGGLPTRSLRFIPILLIIGLLYIAGEESSWGQHIRHMRLPGDPEEIKNDGVPNIDPRVKGTITGDAREKVLHQLSWFKQHNDQGETDLHNLPGIWGDLFGKLPKQIIEFGSVFACVVVPLFLERKWKLDDSTQPASWFWPTNATTLATIVAFLLPWPKRIVEWTGNHVPISLRTSETQEFYLVMVIALYAASLAARLKFAPPANSIQSHPTKPTADTKQNTG